MRNTATTCCRRNDHISIPVAFSGRAVYLQDQDCSLPYRSPQTGRQAPVSAQPPDVVIETPHPVLQSSCEELLRRRVTVHRACLRFDCYCLCVKKRDLTGYKTITVGLITRETYKVRYAPCFPQDDQTTKIFRCGGFRLETFMPTNHHPFVVRSIPRKNGNKAVSNRDRYKSEETADGRLPTK